MKKDKYIKQDTHNYRIHGDKNKQLIKKSIDELGAGRSVLIDSENVLIAGNGVYEQWGDRPIKIIETDGSELVVVKRNDIKPTDEKRKKLAIIDNSSSDNSEFDYELLLEDFDIDQLSNFGLDLQTLESEINNKIIEDDLLIVQSDDRGGMMTNGIKIILGNVTRFIKDTNDLYSNAVKFNEKIINYSDEQISQLLWKIFSL